MPTCKKWGHIRLTRVRAGTLVPLIIREHPSLFYAHGYSVCFFHWLHGVWYISRRVYLPMGLRRMSIQVSKGIQLAPLSTSEPESLQCLTDDPLPANFQGQLHSCAVEAQVKGEAFL